MVEVALTYNDSYSTKIYSFVNNIRTEEGGTHEEALRSSLTRVISRYGKDNNLLKTNH